MCNFIGRSTKGENSKREAPCQRVHACEEYLTGPNMLIWNMTHIIAFP